MSPVRWFARSRLISAVASATEASSNSSSTTAVAWRLNSANCVPPSSTVAPSGTGRPRPTVARDGWVDTVG